MTIGVGQSMILKMVEKATKREADKLIKSGVTDTEEMFKRIVKNPREDKNLQGLLKMANISSELLDTAVRKAIEEEVKRGK